MLTPEIAEVIENPQRNPQQRAAITLMGRTTAQWRKERARKASFAAAVNSVVNRAAELTPEQDARLRAALGGAADARLRAALGEAADAR